MALKKLLDTIIAIAKANKISKPYLVGGFPRDVFMKIIDNVSDLDITCGDESIKILAKKLSEALSATLVTFEDGHSRMTFNKIKIDFSNNFNIPNINKILTGSDINNPTSMQRELYSRDFTINTMLMPLDLSSVIDATGLAMNDIRNQKIDTCLSPRITFGYDPKRVIRIIYMSAKLGFQPTTRVIDWVRKNNNILDNITELYIKSKIGKSLNINPQVTNKMIKTLNLQNKIPYIKGITL